MSYRGPLCDPNWAQLSLKALSCLPFFDWDRGGGEEALLEGRKEGRYRAWRSCGLWGWFRLDDGCGSWMVG